MKNIMRSFIALVAWSLLTLPSWAAPELVVHRIQYEGQLTESEARFAVDIEAENTGRATASLPLFEGDVAVLTTKLPDGLRLERDGQTYQLVASKAGRLKFKLDVVAKITRSEPWNQVSFTGPAAAIASVTARASGMAMEVQLQRGTLAESWQKDGVSAVRGFLGSERVVALRWQNKAVETTRKMVATCETTATAHVTPSVVKYMTQFRFEIPQGNVSKLTVAVPKEQALTRVEGQQIRDWQIAVDPKLGPLLAIEFLKPVEKEYELKLFSEQTLETAALQGALTPPQPLEMTRESGSFTVSAEDVMVEIESAAGLRQVNAPTGSVAAYQYHARPVVVTVRLKRIEPVLTVSARVTARLEEARLLVNHALALRVEKAGLYAVELSPLAGMVVAEVRGDGVEDWKVDGDRLRVNFASRALGARQLDVQLERALKSFPEKLSVVPLRVAWATRQTAQIGASAAPGIRLKTEELTGLREVPVTTLSLRSDELLAYAAEQADWQLVMATERLAPRIIAEVFNLLTIGDGLAGGSATIRYAILNQGVQELRLRVPPHCKNVEFTGPNIRRKEQLGDEWILGLQDKVWGGYTLVVTYDFQFDPQQAALPAAGIHAVGAERENGSIAITSAASLQIRPAPEKKPATVLVRMDETELAAADRALITRPVLLAYKYEGGDYELALAVTRFDEAPVLQAVADRTQLTTVLTEDGQMLSQASFMVKNHNKQFQEFTLPAGADFWSCYVNNQPARAEQDGAKLLVPLPQGDNRNQAFAVDIVYVQKMSSLKTVWPRTVALVAPQTDLQTTYAEWELYVPESHRLAGFGGNMTVAKGTEYGWRDAWLAFCRFYDAVVREAMPFTVLFVIVAGLVFLVGMAIRRGWRGAVAGIAVVVVVGLFAAMLLPALSSARGKARMSHSMTNLRQIGLALSMWADQHEGRMPSSLDELLGSVGSEKIFTDPETGGRYSYVGAGRKWQEGGGDQVVAYSPSYSNGGRNVLFSDGHVEFMDSRRFDDALSRSVVRLDRPTEVPYCGDMLGLGAATTRSERPAAPEPSMHALKDKLNSIILPEISFREGNVADVVRYLSAESRRLDPTGEGVHIVLQTGATTTAPSAPSSHMLTVSLSLRNIPIIEAVKYITAAAGLKYRIQSNAIVILPKDAVVTGELLTRSYPVKREMLANAKGDVKEYFRNAGVPFPEGATIAYNEHTDLLLVRNTLENLEVLEGVLTEASPLDRSIGAESPTVAGIRPIRIDVPKTGARFVFTKVLNVVGREPLAVRAWAVDRHTRNVARSSLQLLAFLIGLAGLWWEWRKPSPGSLRMTVAMALALGSVISLLVSTRMLHVAMILGLPVVGLVVLIWLARKLWKRFQPAQRNDPGMTPPVIAALMLLLAVVTVEGAETRKKAMVETPVPSTGGVSILSATYTGTVREKVAQVEAEWQLNADQPGASVALLGEEVAVQQFQVARGEAKLVHSPGGRMSCSLARRGLTTVKMQFLVKLTGDVTKRRLLFDIPPALLSRVAMTIEEPEAAVEMPAAVSFQTTGDKKLTRLDAILGAGTSVDLQWTPRVKRAAEIAATVFCQNTTLARIGSGAVNLRSQFDYQVTQGELRQARVRVPAGQRLLRVEGETIRTWESKDAEDGSQVVTVDLIKGVSPSYRLTLETERFLETLPATARVEPPRALDVKRETGTVALAAGEEAGLTVEAADGLTRVDAEEAMGATMAYRFLTPEFGLRVRVEALQPQLEAVVQNHTRLGTESAQIATRVDYTIKRAGVFALRLALPDGYTVSSVTGDKIGQWTVETGVLKVALKERVLGAYTLNVQMVKWQKEPARAFDVDGAHPLDTQKLTGYVSVATELGLQAKTATLDGISEIPVSTLPSRGGAGTLAYKYIAAEPGATRGWKLSVATDTVEAWVRAEVVNFLTFRDTSVSGRALIRYEIQNAPVQELRLRAPAAFQSVEINGPNIRRRDRDGDQWRVELQHKVSGSYTLTVTWEQPGKVADATLEVAGVEALGVERETGVVVMQVRPPLRVMEKQVGPDLLPVEPRELPEWAGRPEEAMVLAYRYLRPGYKLSVATRRFEEARVLQALVDNARLTTVVADDGQMMTEMALNVRNNGRQFLEVSLPAGAQVWSAFVAGRAVRPTVREGRLLLPLDRSGGADNAVRVELTYIGGQTFPTRQGWFDLKTPSLDVPLKNARWELYLPADYAYTKFAGTMSHEIVAQPAVSSFTWSDYSVKETRTEKEVQSQLSGNLYRAKGLISSGRLREANDEYSQVAQQGLGANKSDEFKKLEKDLRRAQASNLVSEQMRQVIANAPASVPQPSGQKIGYDAEAAEQQADRLNKAQEVAMAKVMPLRVNLPTHGVRHAFTQVLQTEIGKPMTVRFSATNTRRANWPVRILGGAAVWGVLWAFWGVWIRRRESSRRGLPTLDPL